jgi:His-Xaa-Ser system radical SAM maturase HxsC
MLPLRTAADITNISNPKILKIVGLTEFAHENWPIESSILDLRSISFCSDFVNILKLPWQGIIVSDIQESPITFDGIIIKNVADDDVIRPGDVVRLTPGGKYIQNLYRRSSKTNSLFITEKCNNFCLMCSQPPRDIDDSWRISELFKTVNMIDKDLEWLGITGGEPTIINERLVELIAHCNTILPNTGIHVLSNGRAFTDLSYAKKYDGIHTNLIWGIPLYGDVSSTHDYVVQSHGAFSDTVRGLYSLHRSNQIIEIRIVLQKPTVERLSQLTDFIIRSFPFVSHVALMGLEPIGFTLANRKSLWIDPADYVDVLSDSIVNFSNAGINTSIYNLPLCVLPENLWVYARKSISDWKQKYLSVCGGCIVRDKCGGFFSSHTDEWKSRNLHTILS